MQFHVEAMHCGGCARGVTKAIQSVDPAARVSADPASRTVEVVSQKPREAFLPDWYAELRRFGSLRNTRGPRFATRWGKRSRI